MWEYLYFSEKSELSTYSNFSPHASRKKKKLYMDRRCVYKAATIGMNPRRKR